jgi:hypothetical protein
MLCGRNHLFVRCSWRGPQGVRVQMYPIGPGLALQQAPLEGIRLDGQCIALHLQLLDRCLQVLHALLRLAMLQL